MLDVWEDSKYAIDHDYLNKKKQQSKKGRSLKIWYLFIYVLYLWLLCTFLKKLLYFN